MTRFKVWAPNASEVVLHIGEPAEKIEMKRNDESFVLDVEAAVGTRYGYSVDGEAACPDPRSPSQPDGVHGLSATVDHSAYEWQSLDWRGVELEQAIIYELHIGTFTPAGTFAAAIEKLDHLEDLGITVIEVMPVNEFPGDHGWGYDGVDLYAPHHSYGTTDDVKRFIDACHLRGIGVILDVVYNHLGPDGNYLARFGPYFTGQHTTPWGDAVNFDDEGSDNVRSFVIDNVRMWLTDYHFDGLRLDATHAIIDKSAMHIFEEVNRAADVIERESGVKRLIIAENDENNPRLVRHFDEGGLGFDGVWSDDLHHSVHTALTGETEGYYGDYAVPDALVKVFNDVYFFDGRIEPSRHRRIGRPAGDTPRERFVVCSQNHDQVGNRAIGERMSMLVNDGRARTAAALVLFGPFTPMLFNGEEWGAQTPFLYFVDHTDAQLAEAVAKGRMNEFAAFHWSPEQIPNPQERSTFEKSKLDWSELEGETHASMLNWYRALISLRKTFSREPVVARRYGDVLELKRSNLRLLANFGAEQFTDEVGSSVAVVLASNDQARIDDAKLFVPPDGVVVLNLG